MNNDDWRAETQSRLLKSGIFREFKTRCDVDASGVQARALVDDATFYAFQKTKTILRNMGEFTLHDGDHLFRVLALMEKLLTPDQVSELTLPELMLLILSAFFHDIGMAAEERDVLSWKRFWDSDPRFTDPEDEHQYRLFQRFCAARPDQTAKVEAFLQQGNASGADLLKNYLIADYIRSTHAERCKEIIKKDWDGKITYRDTDLTVEFADICFSHNEDAVSVLNLDRKYLCGPATFACLPLVATILRLADLLDFDAKRTPPVLFSHLFVRHPVSIREWNKHRAVEAWHISPNSIQFHAKCTHPAIQASILAFCDVIDRELSICNNVLSSLNEFFRSDSRKLQIKVPFNVDRSKIETKKTLDGKPEFIYRETQFSLSKSQVIDLLMGTKLYGSPEVALRELLQNSIDACLLRSALEANWNNLYQPEIQVRYATENGEDTLEIVDNGIGMDQYIIDNYYSKIGSSFYKSSDFYDLRSQSRADFVPTSRFGIGILSCFMVADTLIVDTRKAKGPHESSEPVNLTIEGQESIFWVKSGKRMTPGTSTKLILRKSKNPWNRMTEDEFIKSVENVVPNPPLRISIESKSHKKIRDQNSFRDVRAATLKDYSWESHPNIKELSIELTDATNGFIGSAIVALLQKRGLPVAVVEMTSKSVVIDETSYQLTKELRLSGKEISLSTTSISIDENGAIESSSLSTKLCQSKSRLSLHGIEVPTSLFPDYWRAQQNDVSLNWPIPMVLVIDICGRRDLDLNSSRTQVLMSDKWIELEEELSFQICTGIAALVTPTYWSKLKKVWGENTKNEVFLRSMNRV